MVSYSFLVGFFQLSPYFHILPISVLVFSQPFLYFRTFANSEIYIVKFSFLNLVFLQNLSWQSLHLAFTKQLWSFFLCCNSAEIFFFNWVLYPRSELPSYFGKLRKVFGVSWIKRFTCLHPKPNVEQFLLPEKTFLLLVNLLCALHLAQKGLPINLTK